MTARPLALFTGSTALPLERGPLRLLPGLALCIAVTVAALGLQVAEVRLFGRPWLEALVLAILLGAALRTAWTPGSIWTPGIGFTGKLLLEVAVVLLGASISAQTVVAVGPGLLVGIAGVVTVAILAGYGIGRALGLRWRMAVLVACGNAICGNSAIAAVAPVIGAAGADIGASIAFTAVLGVAVVLLLPALAPLLHLSPTQSGALAGLTVYAVPQVLAAAAPMGAVSVQIGTLVKLVRVLMLGPVVVALSLVAARTEGAAKLPPLHRMLPWFILGFLLMAGLRSAGLIPQPALAPIGAVAGGLTILSMAALGLGVDVRVVARAGARVTAAVTLSLLVLGAISLGLIALLRLS